MSWEASRRPFVGEGVMLSRKRGASVGSVVNGQTVTESVSKRSSGTITAGRGLPVWSVPPATVQASPRLTRQAGRKPARPPVLIAAGDNPERLRSEPSWARLCAVAPIEASSGKVVRYRLNPAGDRLANAALWTIVNHCDHPHGLRPAHPSLRGTANQGGPLQEGDHPRAQALSRPRGLQRRW